MEGVPRRERKRLVSGAARQGLLWPAGHREPLFLGSEPPGAGPGLSRTWPGSRFVPTDRAGSVQPLAGRKK